MFNKLYIYNEDNKDHRTSYFKNPPIKVMEELNFNILTSKSDIIQDNSKFINYIITQNIKLILVFFGYEYIINVNIDFLNSNNIKILIYSNDLHYKNNIITETKKNYWNFILNNNNIYFCANYYYCFSKFFDIKPQRIIKYPVFVDDDFTIQINNNPQNAILLSGTKTKEYPARKKLKSIAGYNTNIKIINNCIYQGYDHIKLLNSYLCCFTCCSNENTPYIVAKFFEIPSSGSLLLAYDEFIKEELTNLGFIDGVNYISCTMNNMEEKISYILNPQNRENIDNIRKNAYEFVWKYHTQTERLKYINNIIHTELL